MNSLKRRTARTLLVPMAMSLALCCSASAEDLSRDALAAQAKDIAVMGRNMPFHEARPSDEARHITLGDGTKIALYFHYPEGFDKTSAHVPSVLLETLYGHREEITTTAIDLWRKAGFVVVVSDARGFAASFGNQQWNGATDESDQREVVAWIAEQPWSNGKVAAVGLSISATYADIMTATGAPSLKAAIIRAEDFDHYADNMFPGGVPNAGILELVNELMEWHAGAPCLENLAACADLGFQPVDADKDFSLLQAAMKDHQASLPSAVFGRIVYSDDKLGEGSLSGYSATSRLAGIRKAAVPARVSASWVDGTTAESAIDRFVGAPDVPMEVVIGATTHPAGLDADPFALTPFADAKPSGIEQFQADVDFVKRVLGGEKIGHSVSYAVLGTATWKTTKIWPPEGTKSVRVELGVGSLSATPVELTTVEYAVDPESTFGPLDRWASQRGKPIFYGDLTTAHGKRLEFTGEPMANDMELVGSPELCLVMGTDQTDGTVIAYLEDIAPDGRATYLTEGVLRLLHRKVAGTPCDPEPGAKRSFAKSDGAAVVPGEKMMIELPFLTTAALIKRGHSVRLALAGADKLTFPTLTEDNMARWAVEIGGANGSHLTLPVRPWSG